MCVCVCIYHAIETALNIYHAIEPAFNIYPLGHVISEAAAVVLLSRQFFFRMFELRLRVIDCAIPSDFLCVADLCTPVVCLVCKDFNFQ